MDVTSQKPPNTDQYKVLDEEAFLDTIVDNLRRQLLCAERDGDDLGSMRIVAKNSNDFSETFDVLDNGYIRRRQAAYVTTCTPAAFPIDRTSADVPPAGSGCGRPYPPPSAASTARSHCAPTSTTPLTRRRTWGRTSTTATRSGSSARRSARSVARAGRIASPCENWRVGRAKDTGRYGPTWTNEKGELCTGTATNCSNSPENQYQVRVYRSGKVHASAENGAECLLQVDR